MFNVECIYSCAFYIINSVMALVHFQQKATYLLTYLTLLSRSCLWTTPTWCRFHRPLHSRSSTNLDCGGSEAAADGRLTTFAATSCRRSPKRVPSIGRPLLDLTRQVFPSIFIRKSSSSSPAVRRPSVRRRRLIRWWPRRLTPAWRRPPVWVPSRRVDVVAVVQYG